MNKMFLLLGIWSLFGFNADCNTDFTYRSIKIGNEYSIEMNLKDGVSQEYILELHDVNTGLLFDEKRVNFSSGVSKIVFEKIKPSTYNVFYSSKNCKKKAIRGMGIILN